MLLRSGWTPSRRRGKCCSAKVRVPLRPSHRHSRGRRGGSRPEGLDPSSSWRSSAPLSTLRHPQPTAVCSAPPAQAPLLGLVCHPVAKTQLQRNLSLPTLPLSAGKEGTMLGWSLGSISPWRTHCGSCRQQWGCAESPLAPSWGGMLRPMMLLAGAAVAGSQASPRNAQGSSPGAGTGECPRRMSRAGMQQSLLHLP